MSTTPETTLAALLANRVETMPDLDVLTVEGAGVRPDEVRTYRQLWENGQRLAQVLIDQGLHPGEHFALLMANHAEFIDAMVAASISGTVFVPIDPRATRREARLHARQPAVPRRHRRGLCARQPPCRARFAPQTVLGDRARNGRGREAARRFPRRVVVPRVAAGAGARIADRGPAIPTARCS